MSTNDILERIRELSPSLTNLKIKNIILSKSGVATFEFICDKAIEKDEKLLIKSLILEYIPKSFTTVNIHITKIVADEELVSREILSYLAVAHMSVSHSVVRSNISSVLDGDICSYTLSLDSDIYGYFQDNDVCDDISEHLEKCFCSKFIGYTVNTGKTKSDASILKEKINVAEFETIKCRNFQVGEPAKIWGDEIDGNPIYIADAELVSGIVTFAGRILSINQKETKKGKTYYVLDLDDSTGKIQAKIFMTKEKEKKMDKINVGTQILARGELSVFNGAHSFKIDDLSYCILPEDFKPVERESKSVPSVYSVVTPEPLVEVTQSFLFSEEKPVEECLKGKTFVVFDIETTGLHYTDGDKITEIGAVKIVDGKIVDKFQTLINPEVSISARITELTGINDEMVKDSPTFDKVIPDFFKYVDGAYIIAHNIDFDYNFIKFMARQSGYVFKNPQIDTLAFSKEVFPRLKNHKLNTVCAQFNIEFLHHRALSDAHATAKMFLELVSIKKSLPI